MAVETTPALVLCSQTVVVVTGEDDDDGEDDKVVVMDGEEGVRPTNQNQPDGLLFPVYFSPGGLYRNAWPTNIWTHHSDLQQQ